MNLTHYRKDYQPSAYRILSTHLTFDLKEHETLVTNFMEIERITDTDYPLVLNGENQELFTLRLNDEHLERQHYDWNDTELSLRNLPQKFTLEIVSRIHPESNTSCEGLYKTSGTFCTQCEPHGFRKITFYLDRPDIMSFFTTKIIADKKLYPVLLSNGNLIEQGALDQHRHYAIWQDPFKKPCYLFALVAGDIAKVTDQFITQSGRSVQLDVYAQKEFISQCDYALVALKEAMLWDEHRFGREYDLDIFMIYAASDFNMGAMENKGLNIFNTKFVLTDPTLSTDFDYQMTQAVIGHEYFHNWTGNRVTCRDWFQLSLKEGLTVFRDGEFTADHHDRTLKRIEDASYMRTHQFAEDKSPMAHPIRPDSYIEMNNFYTVTVYEKGCEVIRMIHTLLGETGFRRGMDLYFERHDGQAVTCDDFVAAMRDANDYDLTLFRNWYAYAGTPLVKASGHYNASQKTYTLHFEQSGEALFHIPIALGLISKTGKTLTQDQVFSLKTKTADLVLENISEEPIPSLLRDFSAPIKLEFNYSDEDLKTLAQHDPNRFNRWDAKERLLTLGNPHDAILIFRSALTQAFLYPAYTAEFLNVPNLKTLANLSSPTDPKELIAHRESLLKEISTSLETEFLACYDQTLTLPPSPAIRALKNMCLTYLGRQGRMFICKQQYDRSDNMTDRLAAFAAIMNGPNAELKTLVAQDFFERYQQYPLMLDKWFATQANAHTPDTFENVKALMQHPAFIRTNPNKIYNLVLAFANNFEVFHREDGQGYRLVREFIEEIDPKNHSVASRLVKTLMNFKEFAEPYHSLMRQELEALHALPYLSNDVREIVEKALD